MKERPILFSGPMVRAILDGRKSQTRRIVRESWPHELQHVRNMRNETTGEYQPFFFNTGDADAVGLKAKVQPGDRLWVRETWAKCSPAACDGMSDADFTKKRDIEGRLWDLLYASTAPDGFEWNDEPESKWTPSSHMPRWASRITRDITDVRVERLNDISEEDARAEGVPCASELAWRGDPDDAVAHGHRATFRDLWDSINGQGAWQRNPWVWVYTFKPVTP